MPDIVQAAGETLTHIDMRGVLDILIVGFVFFGLLVLVRGTAAMSLLRGMFFVLLFAYTLGNFFQLTMLNWLLKNSLTPLLVAVPVLFQPELRRALERIGRAGFPAATTTSATKMLDTVVQSSRRLADRRYGALIVLERETGLQAFVETGIELNAFVSVELLMSVFLPSSPLHDGAVIIKDDRITAASCVLPLSDNSRAELQLGTRHRAALGITEQTDAVVVVVSEETSSVSVAANGRIIRNLDEGRLRVILTRLYGSQQADVFPSWWPARR